ncbi:MAG: hypothetical protein AAF387_04810 [Pseudomonadota bacterium]
MTNALNTMKFDPNEISWQKMGSYTGFGYYLLNVDVENRVIDLLFNFEANQQCFYHRHHQPSSALVLHGEQHVWEPTVGGEHNHDIRPTGHFSIAKGAETHIEGGGPDGCIVYQNIRARDDLIYSILNDDLSTKVDVYIRDFYTAFEKQAA